MSIASTIAIVRILLLPVIIYFLNQGRIVLATSLLVLAFLSEFLHEYLHKKGEIRSILDPFSHKIFIIGLLVVFYLQNEFHGGFLLLFVARDIVVTWIKWMGARDDAIVRFDIFSKVMTYLQFGIIFSILFTDLSLFVFPNLKIIFILFSSVMAVLSIVHHAFVYTMKLRRRRKTGRKVEHENMVILVNTKSRGYAHRYRRRLLRKFAKKRKAKTIILSKKGDMFAGIGPKIKEYDHVIIAGGDGSFEAALNHTIFNNKSLGFFPLGAGNAFYSYFYRGKKFEYLRNRFTFDEVELDALNLEWDKGTVETTLLSLGMDADVVKFNEQERTVGGGFSDYVSATIKMFASKPSRYDLSLKIDGREQKWDNVVTITAGKIPYLGFGMRALLGSIESDDKKFLGLATINVHSMRSNKVVRLMSFFMGLIGMYKPPLKAFKASELIIECDNKFPLQVAGEFLGYTHKIKVTMGRRQKVLMI